MIDTPPHCAVTATDAPGLPFSLTDAPDALMVNTPAPFCKRSTSVPIVNAVVALSGIVTVVGDAFSVIIKSPASDSANTLVVPTSINIALLPSVP